jgi:hypothetical protein
MPSLTRGRVCHLYMLLAFASAVFLESESLGTRDHILLSQILVFPFRRLLRLAGSRWRYSTPPPHGLVKVKSKYRRRCLLLVRIHGSVCWNATSCSPRVYLLFPYPWTCLFNTAMVCVQESYLRENVFTNKFPRNAYLSQYWFSLTSFLLEINAFRIKFQSQSLNVNLKIIFK